MLRRTRTEMVKADCRGVMFAIETGGHYWRNIAYFLDEQGIPFRFINQYTLKRRREGKDLNHKKNDYRRLVKERTRITNLVKGLLDGLSPEFTQVFPLSRQGRN